MASLQRELLYLPYAEDDTTNIPELLAAQRLVDEECCTMAASGLFDIRYADSPMTANGSHDNASEHSAEVLTDVTADFLKRLVSLQGDNTNEHERALAQLSDTMAEMQQVMMVSPLLSDAIEKDDSSEDGEATEGPTTGPQPPSGSTSIGQKRSREQNNTSTGAPSDDESKLARAFEGHLSSLINLQLLGNKRLVDARRRQVAQARRCGTAAYREVQSTDNNLRRWADQRQQCHTAAAAVITELQEHQARLQRHNHTLRGLIEQGSVKQPSAESSVAVAAGSKRPRE